MTIEFSTLQEIVTQARSKLPRGEWDYLIGASDTETTMKRNRLAFERLALKARVMTDVSQVQLSRKLLGLAQRIPVLLAPIGSLQVFDPKGAIAVAQAAASYGVIQMLSSVCEPDFETVASASPGPKMFQLYAHGDEAWLMDMIGRSHKAGYKAICLTVDSQVYSRRERDLLKRYLPMTARPIDGKPARSAITLQASLSWALVKRIKKRFKMPLILKGIAAAADATLAVEHGVDAIYVSNHGGRQLDQGQGALDTLPPVVSAVAGRVPIIFDGGILRGTDVLKALALGADAVAIGRLQGLALAAGGAGAVVRMLELLETEMRVNLALMGLASIDQLKPNCVCAADPVMPPGALSGFPLLDEGYDDLVRVPTRGKRRATDA